MTIYTQTTKKIFLLALLLLIALTTSFFLGRWSKPKETELKTIEIHTPQITGKSDTIYKPVHIKTTKDSLIYKDTTIYTESPFNKDLADRFTKLETDKEKVEEYLKTIQTHEYKVPFEDSVIKITGNFKTQGELLSTQYDYVIKPQKIMAEIPVKKPTVAFLLGPGVSNNIKLNKFNINANLGIQKKNGDIIFGSYGILDQSIQIGYLKKF